MKAILNHWSLKFAGCLMLGALAISARAQQSTQRQAPTQPTRKEVAVIQAALKYNLDPKSALLPVHDPVMIKQDSVYYLFATGGGVSSDLLSIAKPEVWYTVARQPRNFALDDTDPGDGTIEAPFIMKRFQYFYLFVSLDYCCRGVNSDYNVVVGRSRNIEGPYVDKDGRLLSRGGGTIVAKGNDRWAGVGHSAHYTFEGKTILIMHGYDKPDNGRSKLIIREMKWDRAEWPSIDL